MDKTWQQFLKQYHPNYYRDRITDYGNFQHELSLTFTHDTIIDLSHKGIIKVSGDEAKKFLQGQLTCNMDTITEQQSTIGAYCNPKGRVLATFRIFMGEGCYYLFMPGTIVVPTLAQLQKYAVFSKATLSNDSNNWVQVCVAGPNIPKLLGDFFNHLPLKMNQVSHLHDCIILNISSDIKRFLIFAPAASMIPLWQHLCQKATPVGADSWQLINIQNGLPTIYPSTIGHFTPHQINFPALGGVSFNKGCYTGQEVVARMEFLGKLKSHLYRAHVDSQLITRPGTKIMAKQAEQVIDAGDVVIAKPDVNGGMQLLAVVKDEFAIDNCCYLNDQPDYFLHFLPLPYDNQRKVTKP